MWKAVISAARAGIKFAWWGNASLNLPLKTPMNDNRVLLAMKFNNIENVDDENEWAEVLTSQVPSTYKQYAIAAKTRP